LSRSEIGYYVKLTNSIKVSVAWLVLTLDPGQVLG
jgi:hypothetical protein